MTTGLHLRPIVRWPGTLKSSHERRPSPFKSPFTDTRRLLLDEIDKLAGYTVVVQLAVDERDLRLDGELRAGARPQHPGVIVSFESKHGALSYATDEFDEPTWRRGEGWHANLRAIALGLQALRAVDRYGIGARGEQYVGWKAIGSGGISLGEKMSKDEALRVFDDLAPGATTDLRSRYRAAVKLLHPDVPGTGDAQQFRALQESYAILTGTPVAGT